MLVANRLHLITATFASSGAVAEMTLANEVGHVLL